MSLYLSSTGTGGSATPVGSNNSIQFNNGGAFGGTGPGTSGQVLTSNGAGSAPTFQAATGGGGITWNDQTTSSVTMAVNNGYVTDNGAGLVTYTLPPTATIGQTVNVAGKSSGGWKIAQAAGQTIHFGNVNTTTGATGFLSSNNQYNCIQLVCVTANTDFVVLNSVGNITTN